jgi:two-component system, OmpR family, alkaline phosphatase synthesis response regulator PhoP
MSRILVVEDNENLAYGLGASLELEGHDVAVAPDGEQGLRYVREWKPDLIVLDVMLPEIGGYQVLKILREEGVSSPVILLTARGEEADKVLGFRLGADDYVTKPFSLLELMARIETRLRRGGAASTGSRPPSHEERFGAIQVLPAEQRVMVHDREVALSPMAFKLLMALVNREGAVASRADLLREVWGHQARVKTRTVDVHISELRRKLEFDSANPTHILTARKSGYRLVR